MPSEAQAFLRAQDPVLAKIIDTIPEPVIDSSGDVFLDLMSCILEQQIHYRSSKKTFEKMLAKASLHVLNPENFEVFQEKALVGTKLSAKKYETLLLVWEFWKEHDLSWESQNDEEVRQVLGGISGIGTWTVDMILLYTLERPDIFPKDDYHLKGIMVDLYGLDPKSRLAAHMTEVAKRWVPHRSLAVKYLLAWKEFNKRSRSTK
jgi:DNA-3-methyladenine glycosylase II